jgi:hypothetical protein
MVPLFTESTGRACTVTKATAAAEEVQPWLLVPHTWYEVLDEGVTTKPPFCTV